MLPKKELANKFECKHGATRCAIFNSDGNYCITGGSDNRISLWNPYTGTNIKTYSGHAGEVTDLAATSDNSCIASSSDDKLVLMWDVKTGLSVNKWRRHLGRVNTVTINDESNIIISGGVDKHVYLWDRRSKSVTPIQGLTEARDSVVSIDSHKWFILTGSVDKCVRLYDIRKGVMSEDCMGYIPVSVRLANDCHLYLTSCNDGKIRLFDIEDGVKLQEFSGHKLDDYRIECGFNFKNSHVFSGSVGHKIFVWELLTGQCTEMINIPMLHSYSKVSTNVVHCVVPHPKSTEHLLAAAGDHVLLFSDK